MIEHFSHSLQFYQGCPPSDGNHDVEEDEMSVQILSVFTIITFLCFSDEGDYKCEITYLDINRSCPVVQVISEIFFMTNCMSISL